MAYRLIAVAAIYLISFIVCYGLLLPTPPPQPSATNEPIPAFVALAAVAILNTALIGWMILRARWGGWRLALASTVVVYGVQTFLPQIETLIFPVVARRMPPGTAAALFVAGFFHAALVLPASIVVLGCWRRQAEKATQTGARPVWNWALRIAVGVTAYVALYFTFGYYVAWTNPAITAYYGGTDPGSLSAQMRAVVRDSPWLLLAQMGRGIIWLLLGLTVIAMTAGARIEKMLMIGALFAVTMNAALIVPNPYMPFDVRMIHLVETASSNFVFGVLVGWLFSERNDRAAPLKRRPTEERDRPAVLLHRCSEHPAVECERHPDP